MNFFQEFNIDKQRTNQYTDESNERSCHGLFCHSVCMFHNLKFYQSINRWIFSYILFKPNNQLTVPLSSDWKNVSPTGKGKVKTPQQQQSKDTF